MIDVNTTKMFDYVSRYNTEDNKHLFINHTIKPVSHTVIFFRYKGGYERLFVKRIIKMHLDNGVME